jgi:hypothetical protein
MVTNGFIHGRAAALAIIPGITFTPDNNGKTTLRKVSHE